MKINLRSINISLLMITRNNLFLLIVVCCLTYSGCDKHKNYTDAITATIETHIDDAELFDMIVILPGSGCTGCISGAERFFIEHCMNDNIKFILTHHKSKKNLYLRLGKDRVDRPNIWIDDDNLFYLQNYEERIYPIGVILEQGQVRKVDLLENIVPLQRTSPSIY